MSIDINILHVQKKIPDVLYTLRGLYVLSILYIIYVYTYTYGLYQRFYMYTEHRAAPLSQIVIGSIT